MGAVPLDPTCDICGTPKQMQPGIGLYCPNNRCGEEVKPVDETAPAHGRYVNINEKSCLAVLEENTRKASASLSGITATQLYGVFSDGSTRRLTSIMMRVKPPKADRRPGATRTTAPSDRHPEGVQLRLASRDGVNL